MATMAGNGRITTTCVQEEIQRLLVGWHEPRLTEAFDDLMDLLGTELAAGLDRFDRIQLADVIKVCRQSPTLAEAGRVLFSASREKKKTSNDSDRLRKYLARFNLKWADILRLTLKILRFLRNPTPKVFTTEQVWPWKGSVW